MAAALSALSASVTRILSLTGFPKELKTKDIQAAFSEWENVGGGFKIKWQDDTSLLLVFADPTVAKRAYLQALAKPPDTISPASSDQAATIRPYDGPDAQNIIQSVNARHNNGRGHNVRASSVSIPSHARGASTSQHNPRNGTTNGNGHIPTDLLTNGRDPRDRDREPSPTLPNLPSHPTLSALIGDSISPSSSSANSTPVDPAILASSMHPDGIPGGPRIGDPGKRMLGHALGMRHPSLGSRGVNGNGAANGGEQIMKAMAGLVVGE